MINADFVKQIWDRVRTSLWFVPGLMVLGALGLAVATPFIDGLISDQWVRDAPLVFSGGAVGARTVLSTIATSAIGVAGVVFSMTIVSLQLASSQFGPRLLRTFLRDRGNQIVLGTFLSTFLYCIVVLPTIDTSGDSAFVPHAAVSIAVLLAIASLAMLVYYIDHIAQSIHADAVMHAVGQELEEVIDQLFPEDVGDAGRRADTSGPFAGSENGHDEPIEIRTLRSGYIRFINGDKLMSIAEAHDLFIRVRLRPGVFATQGDCVAETWPGDRIDDAVQDEARSAFVLGAHRTTLQDVLFTFEQISEVAMRALSPGINDPTTAVHCIDRLGAGIARLVSRELPSRWRTDASDTVRVQIDPVELHEVLDATVIAVSRTAGVHLQVWLRLIEVLEAAAERAKRTTDAELLGACARRLAEHGDAELGCPADQEQLANTSAWARSTMASSHAHSHTMR